VTLAHLVFFPLTLLHVYIRYVCYLGLFTSNGMTSGRAVQRFFSHMLEAPMFFILQYSFKPYTHAALHNLSVSWRTRVILLCPHCSNPHDAHRWLPLTCNCNL
jgi:hypothetical protein